MQSLETSKNTQIKEDIVIKAGDKTPEAVVLKTSGINYVDDYRKKVLSMDKSLL